MSCLLYWALIDYYCLTWNTDGQLTWNTGDQLEDKIHTSMSTLGLRLTALAEKPVDSANQTAVGPISMMTNKAAHNKRIPIRQLNQEKVSCTKTRIS